MDMPASPSALASDTETPPRLLIISASASTTSRTERLGEHIKTYLTRPYTCVDHLRLNQLPAASLLKANADNPQIAESLDLVGRARAIIILTPTYKASYSGLLKMFIDMLPQYALRGKIILPLATGGTLAHMQMLDFALRPVLQTMWPSHIAQGWFVLDRAILLTDEGETYLRDGEVPQLQDIVSAFECAIETIGCRSLPQPGSISLDP